MAVADAGVRKYHEDTIEEEKFDAGIAAAMRTSTKDATDKLYKKLSKIVSVANPALGDEWLEEVKSEVSSFRTIFCRPYVW